MRANIREPETYYCKISPQGRFLISCAEQNTERNPSHPSPQRPEPVPKTQEWEPAGSGERTHEGTHSQERQQVAEYRTICWTVWRDSYQDVEIHLHWFSRLRYFDDRCTENDSRSSRDSIRGSEGIQWGGSCKGKKLYITKKADLHILSWKEQELMKWLRYWNLCTAYVPLNRLMVLFVLVQEIIISSL